MSNNLAKTLLDIGALLVNINKPFRLTSGLNSPFYVNCRLILSVPEARHQLAIALANTISNADIVAGGATAGIPFATLVAERLNLPMVYVRHKNKNHGTAECIEGGSVSGQKVHLIEDTITTSKSVFSFIQTLRNAGATIKGISVLFSRMDKTSSIQIAESDLPFHVICTLNELLETALYMGYINKKEFTEIQSFLATPNKWSAQHTNFCYKS